MAGFMDLLNGVFSALGNNSGNGAGMGGGFDLGFGSTGINSGLGTLGNFGVDTANIPGMENAMPETYGLDTGGTGAASELANAGKDSNIFNMLEGALGEGGIFGDAFKGINLTDLIGLGMAHKQFGEQNKQNDYKMDYLNRDQLSREQDSERYRLSLNNQIRDRQQGRNAAVDAEGKWIDNPGHESTSDYMKKNRIS